MAQEAMAHSTAATLRTTSQGQAAKRQRRIGTGILYIEAILVFSSLKTPSELYMFPPRWFPATPRFENYAEVFAVAPFGRWLLNSVFVAVVATFGAVFSAAITGYSFARFRYPGRDLIFVLTLSTLMLPAEVTLIPLYLLFNKIKWLDT